MSGVGTRVATGLQTYTEQVLRITRNAQTDLLQITELYHQITEAQALDYISDIRAFMARRYLERIEFRWMKPGTKTVVDAFRYKVVNGQARSLDRPGGIAYESLLAQSKFGLILRYSAEWNRLPAADQAAFKKTLKVSWGPADAGDYSGGTFVSDRAYGLADVSLDRERFKRR